jgi:hypothetical protein
LGGVEVYASNRPNLHLPELFGFRD